MKGSSTKAVPIRPLTPEAAMAFCMMPTESTVATNGNTCSMVSLTTFA